MQELEDVRLIELLHEIKESESLDDQFQENSRNLIDRVRVASEQIEAGELHSLEEIKEEFLG